ncbi:MAG: hypothetical protein PVF63_02395 [Gammaproteobacteria bacterium]
MRSGRDQQTRTINISAIAIVLLGWQLQPVANAQSDAEILESARACQRVTDVSSRLSCYDRVLPPVVESHRNVEPPPQPQRSASAAPAAEPDRPLPASVQIVEVETPDLATTVFHAANGRVFVRENARTRHRWPEPPFDVEIETSRFGTSTFLSFPATGLRIRVTVRN